MGDLATLTPIERVDYYKRVCDSLGINHLTRPFEYILFKEYDSNAPAKLSLYARKDCTEQLRRLHRVSIIPPMRKSITDDYCMVEADLRAADGKQDTATGVVPLFKVKDGRRLALEGVQYANAIMKAETKAKRRGTLSICGLGMLDESELDGVEVVGGVTPDGRVWHKAGYDPAEQFHNGSREAAKAVLEEKLSGKRPLHEESTQEPPPAQETPSQGVPQAAKLPPMGEPVSAKWQVTLDWTDETAPIVMGDPEAIEVLKEFLGLTWGADAFWHMAPRNAEKLREFAAKFPFQLKEVMPDVPRSVTKAEPPKERPAADDKPPAEPFTVKGTIIRVNHIIAKSGKRMAYVTVQADGKKADYGCWDKDVCAELEKHKGQEGEVIIEPKGQYKNLVGLVKLGSQDYIQGKVPVVQRRDQLAGAKTLF